MYQYDKIRVGKGADKKYLHYKDIVPMADLNDIVFGTWDVYPQNAYQAAMYAEVLKEKDINPVREELEQVVPMKAAFDKNYAKRLDGDNVKVNSRAICSRETKNSFSSRSSVSSSVRCA